MDVSIVIVTHNTKKLLEDCMQSILGQKCTLEYEIIVVDNGSSDGTFGYFKNKYPEFLIIRNEVSQGFGHGVNSGVKYCKGRNIFILEPDTELITSNTIETLCFYLDNNPQIAVVAPKLILKKNGRVQRSAFSSFPNLITLVMEWSMINLLIGKIFPFLNYRGKYYLAEKDLQKNRKIAWAMGGIVMLKKSVMLEVGGMDETFYLLFEDTDLLKRIADKKYEIWYLAEVKVLHWWGVNQTNIKNSVNLYYDSFKIYFRKHDKLVLNFYPVIIIITTLLCIPVFFIMAIVNIFRNIDLKNMLLFRYYLLKALINT